MASRFAMQTRSRRKKKRSNLALRMTLFTAAIAFAVLYSYTTFKSTGHYVEQQPRESGFGRRLSDDGHANVTEPYKFCNATFQGTTSERIEAVRISTEAYNDELIAANESCIVDFTDYQYYPSPLVDPCALFGWLPYVIGLVYMFGGLAVVCDEYFVPALEVMVDKFDIGDDVAGATLMAAGGSAPELFTSIMGTFLSKNSIGFGTIVGSAVFNVLFVIAMCAIFSKEVLTLSWWPLARDSIFYTISLGLLAVFYVFGPATNRIEWYEALLLLLWYCCYVVLMKNNERLHRIVNNWIGRKNQVTPQDFAGGEKYDVNQRRASVENPLLRPSKFRAGVLHMLYNNQDDMLDNARIHVVAEIIGDVKSTFKQLDLNNSGYIESSELGEMLKRLMHESPNDDRLQHVIKSLNDDAHDGKISLEDFSHWYLKSEERMIADVHKQFESMDTNNDGVLDRDEIRSVAAMVNKTNEITEDDINKCMKEFDKSGDEKVTYEEFEDWYKKSLLWKENMEKNQEDEESEPFELEWPDNMRGRIIFVLTIPIVAPLYFTIPDVRRQGYKDLFPITWLMAIIWIAIFSYFMVWQATLLGDVVGLTPSIMGLTVLAAGTSIPDLITSVIVARQGLGDMAVSSSIGSNIFDILIGLPVPWLLHCLIIGPVTVKAQGLEESILILIFMLFAVVATISVNHWRMTKALGCTMLVLYVVFVTVDLLRQGCSDS